MNLLKKGKEKSIILVNWFLKASLIKKLIIIVILACILWFVVRPIMTRGQQAKVEYQTAQAEKGTLITSVTASGTVSSGSCADITSSATGIVKEIYVKNGDIVSAGDPIALITLDVNSQQQQAQAWASYLSAQNSLNSAKSKMNSLQSALFTANRKFVNGAGVENPITDDPTYIIQRADWLQAEADYNNQANVIRQTEAALSSSWLSYSQLAPTITAPISGVISNLSITPGVAISGSTSSSNSSTDTSSSSSSSQTLGSITLENGTPQSSVNLSEIDIIKIELGQKATLTLDAFPDKTFTGKVAAINTNGVASSGVTSYPITISFDLAVEKMYPNMAVSATIITNVKNSIVLVPVGAVQTSNGESSVRIMKDGQINSVTVETGESNDTQIEITSGISEGDTVVTGQAGGTTSGSSGGQQTTSPFGGTGFGGSSRGGGLSVPAGGQMIMRR